MSVFFSTHAQRVLVLLVGLAAATAASLRPVGAQTLPAAEPIAFIAANAAGGLAFSADGTALVAADGAALTLYDVSDPFTPQESATLTLDAPPAALGVGAAFALAAVTTGDVRDTLFVVAPDRYARGGFGIVNVLDAPGATRGVALSPDRTWALVYGDGGYGVMALTSADNIEQSPLFETSESFSTTLHAAALSDTTAYIVRGENTQLETFDLTTSYFADRSTPVLSFGAPVTALALNADATIGAAALNDGSIALFDTGTFEISATLALEGAASALVYARAADGRELLVAQGAALTLIDPAAATLAPLDLGEGARAAAAAADLLAVSSASGITLLRLS